MVANNKMNWIELLCIIIASDWHWPIILGNARPEEPYEDDRDKCEKGLEERAIDFTVGAVADVDWDDILEDLADGEEDRCRDKIDCAWI